MIVMGEGYVDRLFSFFSFSIRVKIALGQEIACSLKFAPGLLICDVKYN